MANETVFKYLAQSTLITAASSLQVASLNPSTECTSVSSAWHSNYLSADAVLFASFSTSISSNSNIVNLYRRDLNIDSTNDSPQPTAVSPAYYNTYVGQFQIPAFTAASSGYFPLNDIPLCKECQFYIENQTNSPMISTYTVKFTPKTFGPL